MNIIELKNLKKVRVYTGEPLVTGEEFFSVRNILCYGILRKWEETLPTKYKLNNVELYMMFSSYPHCLFEDGKTTVVQKMHDLNIDRKWKIDQMETGAGYDTYVTEHAGRKYHLYIAGAELEEQIKLLKSGERNNGSFVIPEHGDFIRHRTDLKRKRLKEVNKKREKIKLPPLTIDQINDWY